MISDREWDEMRNASQLRLALLRDEIRATRRGNRSDAINEIEGAVNATEQTTGEDATRAEGSTPERDAAIAAILSDNPTAS